MAEIGIITEQGDLGLGFEVLSEQDQEKVNQESSKENDNKEGAM